MKYKSSENEENKNADETNKNINETKEEYKNDISINDTPKIAINKKTSYESTKIKIEEKKILKRIEQKKYL